MRDGWLKLYYRFKDWEWYGDTNMVRLFIHLLLSANFKALKWEGREIPRGSLVTSRAKLVSETTLSPREVRTCINRLISTNEIAVETTNRYSIITIKNFESYQCDEQEGDQQNDQLNDRQATSERPANDQQSTSERPANDQQSTTSKERKKERREEYKNILQEIEGGHATLPGDSDAPPASKPKKLNGVSGSIPFGRIKEDWNATCTAYPKLHVLSEARKNKIRNRIAEMGGPDAALPLIHSIFEKMMQSKFLRGDNKRGWKASFDWIFENDKNWVKVYEGNYDPTPDNLSETIIPKNDNRYGPTTRPAQNIDRAARQQEFARHIATRLTSPDDELDVSGNY